MSDAEITLAYVNQSTRLITHSVVFFQNNLAYGPVDEPIAWEVVESHGVGDVYPLPLPSRVLVAASDAFGNVTLAQETGTDAAFDVVYGSSSRSLLPSDVPPQLPGSIEVHNRLERGGITALLYRNQKLLSQCGNVAPGQRAIFAIAERRLGVVLADGLAEGQALEPSALRSDVTQLNLEGVLSAEIHARDTPDGGIGFMLDRVESAPANGAKAPADQTWSATPGPDGARITIRCRGEAGDDTLHLTFTDHSTVPDGVSGELEALREADGWAPIPTVAARGYTIAGFVAIANTEGGRFLRLHLSFGRKLRRTETGQVLRLPG
jgi:hypothetical protein